MHEEPYSTCDGGSICIRPAAFAQGASDVTPGHKMQNKGSPMQNRPTSHRLRIILSFGRLYLLLLLSQLFGSRWLSVFLGYQGWIDWQGRGICLVSNVTFRTAVLFSLTGLDDQPNRDGHDASCSGVTEMSLRAAGAGNIFRSNLF
jgi:hypothetical protein